MPDILVVNDSEMAAKLLLRFLKNEGYQTACAPTTDQALASLRESAFHLLLMDSSDDPARVLTFAQAVHKEYPAMPVLVGVPLGTAVPGQPALNGPELDPAAISYVPRPFNVKHLLSAVQDILEFQEERARGGEAAVTPLGVGVAAAGFGENELVTQSDAMQKLLAMLERIAPTEIAVYLYGEKGTEKEALARALHQRSRRRDKPFVAFHCADIAPDDLTAALFGSVEESATSTRSGVASAPFDRARTGTLFLDDLLLVPPAARLRLADALATTATKGGKASAPKPRIVSAADVPPERLVAKGFDPVLARVLTGVTLEVKPLRERPEDILALAQQALKREAGPATELSVLDPKVTAMLTRYNWPGNTAELEKFVIQAWRKATTK